ncbi:hypothetical protein [Halovivax sp.]|uniref:hypothetical protein n=1 Tax=Halovivax sp. TaxID=1935978 RepID=UPI0025C486E3|nr:hypothetical protein [Halovivax sp.]
MGGRRILDRRRLLLLAGATIPATTAGCLEGGSLSEPDSNDAGGADPDRPAVDVEYDIENEWTYTTAAEVPGDESVVVVTSRTEADRTFEFDRIDRAEIRESRRTFVERTDFGESLLCFVRGRGPQTGYYLEVEKVSADAERIDLRIVTSHDDAGVGDAVSEPTALVRLTPTVRPSLVRVTIVDGWDEISTAEVKLG